MWGGVTVRGRRGNGLASTLPAQDDPGRARPAQGRKTQLSELGLTSQTYGDWYHGAQEARRKQAMGMSEAISLPNRTYGVMMRSQHYPRLLAAAYTKTLFAALNVVEFELFVAYHCD